MAWQLLTRSAVRCAGPRSQHHAGRLVSLHLWKLLASSPENVPLESNWKLLLRHNIMHVQRESEQEVGITGVRITFIKKLV